VSAARITEGLIKMDERILNRLMQGPVEVSDIYREVESNILYNAFLPQYKIIFSNIKDYYSRHKVPPSYDVLKNISSDNNLSLLIDSIEGEDCSENDIGYYIDSIKNRYNKYLLNEIPTMLSSDDYALDDVNSRIKNIVSITNQLDRGGIFSEGELSRSVVDRFDNYRNVEENPGDVMGILSGYNDLDECTWGIKNSEMMVIAGGSSSGKSLLMLNMAINAWLGSNDPTSGSVTSDDGKNIVFFSLEMSKLQLEQRVDANLANIRHRSIIRGSLNSDEKSRWKKSLDFQRKYEKSFYIVDMPRGSTMSEVSARYESIVGMFSPDAVFVDYLQLMSPSIKQTGSDWQDVGKVSEEMHEFCRRSNIPVITAAQRKARQKQKSSKEFKDHIDLEDIGRSKMIGDNSNIVLLIEYREDEYLREDMPIHIVKNRDGAKGKISLKKEFECSRIVNLPDGWAESVGDENEI